MQIEVAGTWIDTVGYANTYINAFILFKNQLEDMGEGKTLMDQF